MQNSNDYPDHRAVFLHKVKACSSTCMRSTLTEESHFAIDERKQNLKKKESVTFRF